MEENRLPEGLRRFMRPRPAPPEGEICDLCNASVPEEHGHVVQTDTRNLLCACRACSLLFVSGAAAGGRYRAVPDRYQALGSSVIDEAQWDRLQIPVGIAFLFFNSNLGRTAAFYPGPAGAAESLLALETWSEIAAGTPDLGTLAPDVEALLVRRHRAGGFESFLVPIDACYELVGRIKRTWKGFDGGEEAWSEIEAYFDRIREKSAPAPAAG